jgi:glycosyltransferase involved in cell wall biosynthesis
MEKISIVIPCFNEEEILPFLYKELSDVIENMKKVCFEIIFVDDGSTDKTLEYIKYISKKDNYIKFLSFSRNFGQESAILAGLRFATGDYVCYMDADLQDPTCLIKDMYSILKNNSCDIVIAKRNRKGENILIRILSILFYKIFNKFTELDIEQNERNFRMFSKKVNDSILSFNEYNRYIKGIFNYIGFNKSYIEYDYIKRKKGKTKYGFKGLIKYAYSSFISWSLFPLRVPYYLSILFLILTLILFNNKMINYSYIICLFTSIEFLCIGILGSYISKMILETKKRPLYIVKEDNFDKK